MLGLNQGIYEHFLWSRGDNSTIRYWLLARRGLWEDVPDDSDKNKFQPSAWAECAGVLKRPTFTTTKKGQVAWRELLVSGGHVAVWRNQRKVPGVHVAEEWTSSVDEVQRLLKQQLGFEVILLDANTSSTNEVSSVSNTVHLELFSDFARWQHVHHTSDFFHITRPFLVVVRVGHFS